MHLIKTKPVQIKKYECEDCGIRFVDYVNWGKWYRFKICPECGGEMLSEQILSGDRRWICQKCRKWL